MASNTVIKIVLEYQRKTGPVEIVELTPEEYFDSERSGIPYSYDESIPRHNHGIEYISNCRNIIKTTLCVADRRSQKKKIVEELFSADGVSRFIFINEFYKKKKIYSELITDIVLRKKHPVKRRITRVGKEGDGNRKIYLDSLITEYRGRRRRHDLSRDYM